MENMDIPTRTVSKNAVPRAEFLNTIPREQGRVLRNTVPGTVFSIPWGSISQYTPYGAGGVLENMDICPRQGIEKYCP